MTASATYAFLPENADLVIEAWERLGKDKTAMPGTLARSARMSMDLMFSSWSNMHINLWCVEPITVPLTLNTTNYPLETGTIDIMDAYLTIVATARDIVVGRFDRASYNSLPVKTTPGQPNQFYLNRGITPSIYIWPVASADGLYTLTYWRLRRIQDVGAAAQTPDVSYQWFDAIAAGLAARLAVKWAVDRVPLLDQQAKEAFTIAVAENRQRGNLTLMPDVSAYRILS